MSDDTGRYLRLPDWGDEITPVPGGTAYVQLPSTVRMDEDGVAWVPVGDVIQPDYQAAEQALRVWLAEPSATGYARNPAARRIVDAALGVTDETHNEPEGYERE